MAVSQAGCRIYWKEGVASARPHDAPLDFTPDDAFDDLRDLASS